MPTMSSSKDDHHVNNLLHNLRGEHFRHQQNILRSRSHLLDLAHHNQPTLPLGFTLGEYHANSEEPRKRVEIQSTSNWSGPPPPKSWRKLTAQPEEETEVWRSQALSLILSHLDSKRRMQYRIPSLTLLCCLKSMTYCTSSEFKEEITPYIPSHLRQEMIRFCAIHSPLPNARLYPLFEPDGHADGEIIIAGPQASLRDEYFLRRKTVTEERQPPEEASWDWEDDKPTPNPLESFILLSTPLASSTLFTLPPTITRMALINLPSPISIHRLPGVCPLLIVLDLSYNNWLKKPSKEVLNVLDRVDWTRWGELRTLGLRACSIPTGILQKVNQCRWDDVDFIL